MKSARIRELTALFNGRAEDSIEALRKAELTASGYAWALDESQPVSDEELEAVLDEMRAALALLEEHGV